MKKVLVFTGPEQNCGIYQYGASLVDAFNEASSEYVFELVPTDDRMFARDRIANEMPAAIIYNHHPWTLGWLDSGFTRPVRNELGIKQIMITGHEHINQYVGVDAYVHTDPRFIPHGTSYAAIPPVIYYDDVTYSPPSDVVKIGTSGLANRTKNIDRIIEIINEQFTNDVIFNLHIIDGQYIDPSGALTNNLIASCRSIAKSNVDVRVCRDFFNRKDLVKWLNGNDINLYVYNSASQVPGVSASIDKALASKKPFGVNSDILLSHVRKPYNNLDRVSIQSIIDAGIEPLQEFYDEWNPKTLVERYENIINAAR
jgi:hypothetical protein